MVVSVKLNNNGEGWRWSTRRVCVLHDGLTADGIHIVDLYTSFMMAEGRCDWHKELVPLDASSMPTKQDDDKTDDNDTCQFSEEAVAELPSKVR